MGEICEMVEMFVALFKVHPFIKKISIYKAECEFYYYYFFNNCNYFSWFSNQMYIFYCQNLPIICSY